MPDDVQSATPALSETPPKSSVVTTKRQRQVRPFPASSFEDALLFARQILEFGSGQPVRRVTFFDHLKKSPESSASRQAITNASKYGLTAGSYSADSLELTAEGKLAADEQTSPRERAKIFVKLAIENIDVFNKIFKRFLGNKLPATAALIDAAKDAGIAAEQTDEAVDTFIVNLRFTGLLRTLSGAERIVDLGHVLESIPPLPTHGASSPEALKAAQQATQASNPAGTNFDNIVFYIAPIGNEGSDNRKHSDLFLGSFVEPALQSFSLQVVRADEIDQPGIITKQIIEYLIKSRLVIADLSFHNPNVFYELAIRHMLRKPVVQIMRSSEKIPFDINQVRTIVIDTSDIYSLVPKIETYRAEIANQARRALEDPDAVDSPISLYFPTLHSGVS